MKRTILFFSILLVAATMQAQDIFKKHGYNRETLTLSKGRYKETFVNENVMQIGTVLIDTRTDKVVQFLEEDATEVVYRAESTSRFLTPDPLAEKYPWLSPYAYCANNPVRYIDPTGMDWYQAENGNVMWRKSQDEEYKDDDGNVWKNIGTEYTFVSGNKATHFQQQTNKDGELYLSSTSYTITDENADKLQADKEAVLSWQSSDASIAAALKYWDNPTAGNWFKYVITEVASQYTDPYKVVGGLSVGVAGYASITPKAIGGLKYAPRVRTRAMQDPVSHNFPYSFDKAVLSTKPTVTSSGYKIYQLSGVMNGKQGVFEIGVNANGIIDHRFFRPK